jgi:hypothetical protein
MSSMTSGTQTEERQEERRGEPAPRVQAPAAAATAAQPAETATDYGSGVRRRSRMITYPGHHLYPTTEFLTNAAYIVRQPSRMGCDHAVLDRTGTNQHKNRFTCEQCGCIWSGRG